MMSRRADQAALYVPTPAHMTIKASVAIVEYARTRLASLCDTAMNEANRNVTAPMQAMQIPAGPLLRIGETLSKRQTPAFTIVLEWRSADTGVGATMAPVSHVEKGICADFTSPAKARSTAGSITAGEPSRIIRSRSRMPARDER